METFWDFTALRDDEGCHGNSPLTDCNALQQPTHFIYMVSFGYWCTDIRGLTRDLATLCGGNQEPLAVKGKVVRAPRGTVVSGLKRGLATLPQGGSRSLQWSETGMEDPQEDPLAVHCFCVCSGSALLTSALGVSAIMRYINRRFTYLLLGDILGVRRSRARDLSVLSIYPRIILCLFIVYRRIVRILCLLYSAIC